ncbi:MAG: LacI family DNA-binding transcriptional regulator [Microbacteriaceae bacterium]|nr:LacI family DNA-binding transcriptional regulator [Microbacteriaceae bacterium]
MTSPAKRARLADVAARAGVSATAASLVLNNVPGSRISEETRTRIFESAEALNFRFNVAARGLATSRTHTIAFISDEIASSEFAGGMIAGSQKEAWDNGLQLVVIDTGGRAEVEESAVNSMIEREVEGVIFAAMSAKRVEPPPVLSQVPTVLLNCFATDSAFPTVLADEVGGGFEATRALIAAGHSRIGFVNGNRTGRGEWASEQRRIGYETALREAGLAVEDELVVYGNWRPDGGYAGATQLLELSRRPTGIVCGNDRMAFGAYEAVRQAGLRVPDDVSIVGYDNQPLSQFLFPPLTTVELPHAEMGRRACRLLRHLIADPAKPPVSVTVRTPLVRRASVFDVAG